MKSIFGKRRFFIESCLCFLLCNTYYMRPSDAFSTTLAVLPKTSPTNRRIQILRSTKSESTAFSSNEEKQRISAAEQEYSFYDEASIYVRAGSGGQGASTYKKAKKSQNGIPDGGSGGLGGNVYLQVDSSLNTLANFHGGSGSGGGVAINDNNQKRRKSSSTSESQNRQKRLPSFRAENGYPGGRMYDNGRGGEDCFIRVPPGTVVSIEREKILFNDDDDVETITEPEVTDRNEDGEAEYEEVEIGTLSLDNQPELLVARGGRGGEGTATLKGKKKGATRRGPDGGERHRLRLTLKLVADVALVGVPNAGKSTFLSAVTRAEPKIANYPFTTVVPNLGVWIPPGTSKSSSNEYDDSNGNGEVRDKAAGSTGIVLCDVPGLIAGAADGVGLGHAFLRHVERCRVILHLVDGTAEDPVGDYLMVNEEIQKYGTGSLANMPQVVVVNKIDAWENEPDGESRKAELEEGIKAAMGHTRLLWVSAKERQNMDELMLRMAAYVGKIKEADDA